MSDQEDQTRTRRVVAAYHESRPEYQRPNSEVITALCDDGTVWQRTNLKSAGNLEGRVDWRQLDSLPQP